ncbi:hypothetical protein BH708_07620 [Brachybacterium sp. P6-10-X1]|uniref:hypothetical protein n=1 Tax=Brachybacterium sp. P6-10-X1 TaxID=1903186 RepID=UPI0009719AB0|nr:hypothetical protein [Brachybacterium sp. P6-10-X1]APX32608.1 hypothetical protein BH708_07620 [Brachybacterium sp. P6-10-X1]
MGTAHGFHHEVRRSGDVVISHHGTAVTVLRGMRAARFLEDVEIDPQGTMARWTGHYKHGNERAGKEHRRNRGRR